MFIYYIHNSSVLSATFGLIPDPRRPLSSSFAMHSSCKSVINLISHFILNQTLTIDNHFYLVAWCRIDISCNSYQAGFTRVLAWVTLGRRMEKYATVRLHRVSQSWEKTYNTCGYINDCPERRFANSHSDNTEECRVRVSNSEEWRWGLTLHPDRE